MNKLFKRSAFLTMVLIFISQTSLWAQGANDNQDNSSLSPAMVVLFFALLLIALIAPAFKVSHKSHRKISSYKI